MRFRSLGSGLVVLASLLSLVNGFLHNKNNNLRRRLSFLVPNKNKILKMTSSTTATTATESTASTPTTTTSTSSSSSTSTLPNWRLLDNNKDDPSILLSQREEWSEACYQDALKLYEQLTQTTDSYVSGQMEAALQCLDHAYRLYGPESVICSFNGGKDAVVILHLVRAAHAHYYRKSSSNNNQCSIIRPRVVYFDHEDEFPQVMDFLQSSVQQFDLDMICFPKGTSFSQGLQVLVDNNIPHDTNEMNFPMAFVLGTRTTDPNAGKQGFFAPSSHYMPPFMRVNPILEWTYGHVWHFLRLFQLRYCCLYDQGYTSLGTTKDTLPCPALAVVGGGSSNQTSIPKYWPAYMLRDWDQERAGRIQKEKKTDEASESNNSLQQSQLLRANSSMVPSSNESDKDGTIESVKPLEDASCVSYSSNTIAQRTVGLLIIGDEILKGFTADTNTQAAAKALRTHNVRLERAAIISDSQEAIVHEIRRLQSEVDVIITSGGVGPTHDDVTIKSVAVALDCEMVLHEEMAQLLRDKMKNDNVELTEAQRKMATLPSTSKLRYLSDNPSDWPVLQCQNIFILPGVPEFFEGKIENVAAYLSCQLERSIAYKVVLSVDETSIVNALNRVVDNHPNVSFGSYPFVSHPDYKTVITVEARLLTDGGGIGGRSNSIVCDRSMIDMSKKQMDQHVQLALDELINTLPDGSVLRVDNDDMALFS